MSAILDTLRQAAVPVREWIVSRVYRNGGNGGKRVLVNEILSIQILSAALFGGLARTGVIGDGDVAQKPPFGPVPGRSSMKIAFRSNA